MIPTWLKEHKAARVLLLYLPVFAAFALLALSVAGVGYADLRAYVLELAARSVWAIGAVGLAVGWMQLTGMDLPNAERRRLQRILLDEEAGPEDGVGNRWLGAFLILAGESLAWAASLVLFALVLLRWQG